MPNKISIEIELSVLARLGTQRTRDLADTYFWLMFLPFNKLFKGWYDFSFLFPYN